MEKATNPTLAALKLRRGLLDIRTSHGITQQVIAQELEWHPSKVLRIENGQTSINMLDLGAYLETCGVTDPVVHNSMQAHRKEAKSKAWWKDCADEPKEWLTYIGYSLGATAIRHVSMNIIPPSLQVEEYTQLLNNVMPGSVQLWEKYRRAMATNSTFQAYVFDESVLHLFGNTDVTQKQLTHLAREAQEPRISINIIPFSTGAHVGMLHPWYTIFSFPDTPEVLHTPTKGFTEFDSAEVSNRLQHFQNLGQKALSASDSIEFINKVAGDLEGKN